MSKTPLTLFLDLEILAARERLPTFRNAEEGLDYLCDQVACLCETLRTLPDPLFTARARESIRLAREDGCRAIATASHSSRPPCTRPSIHSTKPVPGKRVLDFHAQRMDNGSRPWAVARRLREVAPVFILHQTGSIVVNPPGSASSTGQRRTGPVRCSA